MLVKDTEIQELESKIMILEQKIAMLEEENRDLNFLNNKLFTAIENSPAMMVITDRNGKIEYSNPAFTNVTGYSLQEIKGLTFNILKSGRYQNDFYSKLWNTILAGKNWHGEFYNKKKNGDYYWDQTFIAPIKNENGEIINFVANKIDITNYKLNEQKLIESEKNYRLLAENVSDTIWRMDVATFNLTYVSPLTFMRTGYTVDEMMSLRMEERFSDESKEYVQKVLPERLAEFKMSQDSSKVYIDELHQKRKDGSLFWIETSTSFKADENGNVKEIFGITRNIDERKKAELRNLILYTGIEQSADSVVITDATGQIEYVNRQFTTITGYTLDEAIGKNPKILKTDFHSTEFYQNLWETILSGKVWEGEFLNKKKNGELYWELAHIAPISDPYNRITHFIATKLDITEKKKQEQIIKESEKKFKMIFDKVSNGIVIENEKQEIMDVNEAMLILTGFTTEEIKKLSQEGLLIFKNTDNQKITLNNLRNQSVRHVEGSCKTSTGKLVEIEVDSNNTELNGETLTIFIIRDITEQKKQKYLKMMIEAEEKERVRIAREIHDGLGPIVSTVKLYVNALNLADNDQEKQEVIDNVNSTLNEMVICIKEISNNLSPHILENFGLISAIKSFVQRIKDLKRYEIEFIYNFNERINPMLEISLYRIIIELVNNTGKYAKAKKVNIELTKQKNLINLYYSDDGIGFEISKSVFQKGFGIQNIESRVNALNGEVYFETSVNKGFKARFIFNEFKVSI